MTDNLKKFLEEASKDADFTQKISKADSTQTLIALAAEKGFTLTEEELEQLSHSKSVSDDELEAVAGGGECFCLVGGGGTGGTWVKSCACVLGGGGEMSDGSARCVCVSAGTGEEMSLKEQVKKGRESDHKGPMFF